MFRIFLLSSINRCSCANPYIQPMSIMWYFNKINKRDLNQNRVQLNLVKFLVNLPKSHSFQTAINLLMFCSMYQKVIFCLLIYLLFIFSQSNVPLEPVTADLCWSDTMVTIRACCSAVPLSHSLSSNRLVSRKWPKWLVISWLSMPSSDRLYGVSAMPAGKERNDFSNIVQHSKACRRRWWQNNVYPFVITHYLIGDLTTLYRACIE